MKNNEEKIYNPILEEEEGKQHEVNAEISNFNTENTFTKKKDFDKKALIDFKNKIENIIDNKQKNFENAISTSNEETINIIQKETIKLLNLSLEEINKEFNEGANNDFFQQAQKAYAEKINLVNDKKGLQEYYNALALSKKASKDLNHADAMAKQVREEAKIRRATEKEKEKNIQLEMRKAFLESCKIKFGEDDIEEKYNETKKKYDESNQGLKNIGIDIEKSYNSKTGKLYWAEINSHPNGVLVAMENLLEENKPSVEEKKPSFLARLFKRK